MSWIVISDSAFKQYCHSKLEYMTITAGSGVSLGGMTIAPAIGTGILTNLKLDEKFHKTAATEQVEAWKKSEIRGMLNFIKWVIKGEIWEPLKQKTTQFARRAWLACRRSSTTK